MSTTCTLCTEYAIDQAPHLQALHDAFVIGLHKGRCEYWPCDDQEKPNKVKAEREDIMANMPRKWWAKLKGDILPPLPPCSLEQKSGYDRMVPLIEHAFSLGFALGISSKNLI